MADLSGYAHINGLRMYYEVHGEGPPLLLLHGGTCSIDPDDVALFSDRFRVIAPEQMGHGHTADDRSRAFHYHDMAEDTVELMRRLEIERAVVVGFSDGGILGLDMAMNHPDRVTKLVLSGTNFSTQGLRPGALEWMAQAKGEDWPAELREAYEERSPDGPTYWPLVIERIKAMWLTEPNYVPEQLARILAPTLVVAGDQDSATAEHSVALFRAIPNSQLCILPNARHGVMPKELMLTFLEEPESTEE